MAIFQYEGKLLNGKRKKGRVTAVSLREAKEKLRQESILVTELAELESTGLNKEVNLLPERVKIEHLIMYVRQFATLIRAGVPIVRATSILRVQTESKVLKKTLSQVEDDLREGIAFSEAIKKHPRVFSNFFSSMALAGEASGNLEEALDQIGLQLQKQYDVKRKVISALTYPLVVSIVAIGVVAFLMVNVVPTFASIFGQLGGELPLITRIVVAVSDFVAAYWWLIFGGALLALLVFTWMLKRDKERYVIDGLLLKMPIFGPIVLKSQIALLTRSLAVLLQAAVPILSAIEITEKIVSNRVIRKGLAQARKMMAQGIPLHEPLERNDSFPPLMTQMIAVGEESGDLDSMLNEVAEFYETEVETTTDRLKSIIEPLLIVVLASIVGVIVIAIVVPMFQIYGDIQNQ
ncbi:MULTISPECIES: type II secretion system F family protein [Exiguobacterium]|uniref:Type II secretion system F family protein n=1 Tax=Exiguobacterium mexicanum TaxID=340146 RepID=A0ABT7MJL4_9BACL|nr:MULTISPECIES: type II secretion system F family protein [Exiguobacterium]KGI84886.1 secretion system protein [Exiguobacterium mexicanum]MDL5375610.1 type II secretion system F family protein [Exiguobacterium mexicanum]TCI73662.1 type II secretion system F family protein [Exiguobacterium sp. IPCI3]TCI82820.1 type II secretion system F family protein [Exiguobacterium sp. IPCH1]TCI83874.1 type II secretion system F family protein [Exiguobacterium sp. IPBC4]